MRVAESFLRPLLRGLLAALFLGVCGGAWAHRIFYDFSGMTGDEGTIPFVGSLYFDAEAPLIGDEWGTWATTGGSAGLHLRVGDREWAVGDVAGGSCIVYFHMGWSDVGSICWTKPRNPDGSGDSIALDFFEETGKLLYWGDDPHGPFDNASLRLFPTTASFEVHGFANGVIAAGMGNLDHVRRVPEPAMPGMLVCVALAAGLARTRRPRHRR